MKTSQNIILAFIVFTVSTFAKGVPADDGLAGMGYMREFEEVDAIPTPTSGSSSSVKIPYKPTTFDAEVCSAYPEICRNAGLLAPLLPTD